MGMTMRQNFAPLTAEHSNNLNLIRLIAALSVLVSHAWPITLGPGAVEPLEALTGFSLGALSVFTFFAISGFLISASFERSDGLWTYLRARAARIYPGLIVSIALVTLGLGPIFSTLPVPSYFAASETWQAFFGNSSLLRLHYHLPGVFEDTPYKTVQGSLWTLPVEMRLYVVVALLGLLGMFRRPVLLALTCGLGLLVISFSGSLEFRGAHALRSLWYPGLPFFLGMAMYLARNRLPASSIIAFALVLVSVLCAHGPLGYVTMALAVSYAVLYLAGRESGPLRLWNQVGDYSYGTYIYAFPVQGMVIALWGGMSPVENIAISAPITLGFAVLSWHWVERPAMRAIRRRGQVKPQISTPSASSGHLSTGP